MPLPPFAHAYMRLLHHPGDHHTTRKSVGHRPTSATARHYCGHRPMLSIGALGILKIQKGFEVRQENISIPKNERLNTRKLSMSTMSIVAALGRRQNAWVAPTQHSPNGKRTSCAGSSSELLKVAVCENQESEAEKRANKNAATAKATVDKKAEAQAKKKPRPNWRRLN